MKSSPRSTKSPNNSPTTVAFSVAPCRMPKIVFRPSSPMPNAATICCPANGVASISNAHIRVLSNRRSSHVLQLRPARLDEMFADYALLQPIRLGELAHSFAVFPRAQSEHQLLPHCFR